MPRNPTQAERLAAVEAEQRQLRDNDRDLVVQLESMAVRVAAVEAAQITQSSELSSHGKQLALLTGISDTVVRVQERQQFGGESHQVVAGKVDDHSSRIARVEAVVDGLKTQAASAGAGTAAVLFLLAKAAEALHLIPPGTTP
jgi:hypothetical protein